MDPEGVRHPRNPALPKVATAHAKPSEPGRFILSPALLLPLGEFPVPSQSRPPQITRPRVELRGPGNHRAHPLQHWLQVIAIRAPGVEHAGEPLEAANYNLPWAIVSLVMVWAVIGFLLYGLRELVAVNSRMRRLYEGGRAGSVAEVVGDVPEGDPSAPEDRSTEP